MLTQVISSHRYVMSKQFKPNKINRSTSPATSWLERSQVHGVGSNYQKQPTVIPRIVVATTILFLGLRCDTYSRETTIQGRKLFFRSVQMYVNNLNCCRKLVLDICYEANLKLKLHTILFKITNNTVKKIIHLSRICLLS